MANELPEKSLDLSGETPSTPESVRQTPYEVKTYNPEEEREVTRGDLARGLLWLLTFTVGGLIVFTGLGRLEGSALTQSVFPSLIALAGTALGFYFGSQAARPREDAGTKINPTS